MNAALALLLVALTSCGTAPAGTVSTAEGATGTLAPAVTPTETETPAPTTTPKIPVSVGTSLPAPSTVLSTDNVDQIVELAKWGRGVIAGLAYSPDGKTIALASTSGIVLVDADTLKEVNFAEAAFPAYCVAFSSDGTLLGAGLRDGTAVIWDAKTGHLLQTLAGPKKEIDSVSFSPDGQLMAGGSQDGSVAVWQVADGTLLVTSPRIRDQCLRVEFSGGQPEPVLRILGSNSSIHSSSRSGSPMERCCAGLKASPMLEWLSRPTVRSWLQPARRPFPPRWRPLYTSGLSLTAGC